MLDELAFRLPTHSYLATISRVVTGEDVIIHEAQGDNILTLIDFIGNIPIKKKICNKPLYLYLYKSCTKRLHTSKKNLII